MNPTTSTSTSTSTSLVGQATASLTDLGQTTLRSLIQPQRETDPATESESGTRAGTRSGMLEERSRQAAQWDPALRDEDVNWYAEYAARHGSLSLRWLSQANKSEVRGMGVLCDDKVLGPLEDGSVCIWDITHRATVGKSTPGTLAGCRQDLGSLGECVSVDSARRRAYLAVGCVLNEVDLDTLDVVSTTTYPETVFALTQETDYEAPVTVATTQSLHMYDPRTSGATDSASVSLLEPGPLAVLHPGVQDNTILVAGRFPSILSYDRRVLRLQSAVHSGGGLCGLATVPARCTGSNNKAEQKVVACGEYKGRGSLELYDLGPEGLTTRYRNRQSAARYKLLSVASHGTRIVYADADGMVKWVERDARTEVRRCNIGLSLAESRLAQGYGDGGGLFGSSSGSNEVVRKVAPTKGTLTDDTVLLWTGESIGCLSLRPLDKDHGKEEEEPEEDELTKKEREYSTTMRKALERQADEVRRMEGFGL